MGFISSAEVVSCSAKDLTGEYLGQTSPKIIRQFERALGKVPFIDEAYRLGQGSQYGIEAAGEIVTAMTKPRYLGNMVVILAGYETEMAKFMRLNPGLRSRFPTEVDFPQMEPGNCFRLFQQILGKVSIEFSSSAEGEGDQLIVLGVEAFRQLTSVAGWANGRDVESLAQKMMAQAFIREGEAESEVVPEKLIVSYGELLDFLMEELKVRGCSDKRSNFSSDAFRERLRHVGFDADVR
jgi:SpoVK/Ycf46/Vps4 family AAA+-type ATPase